MGMWGAMFVLWNLFLQRAGGDSPTAYGPPSLSGRAFFLRVRRGMSGCMGNSYPAPGANSPTASGSPSLSGRAFFFGCVGVCPDVWIILPCAGGDLPTASDPPSLSGRAFFRGKKKRGRFLGRSLFLSSLFFYFRHVGTGIILPLSSFFFFFLKL